MCISVGVRACVCISMCMEICVFMYIYEHMGGRACVCVCLLNVHICGHVHAIGPVDVRGNLQQLILTFHYEGFEDQAFVVKLGGKPLYSLSHITSPMEGILQVRVQ